MGFRDRIEFSPDFTKYQMCNQGSFDILHNISENFTLLKLMKSVGNINNAVSILGYWIIDSNQKRRFR